MGPSGYDFWENHNDTRKPKDLSTAMFPSESYSRVGLANMQIYVYAHDSQCRRFLDQEFACVAQKGGSAQCDNVEDSQRKKKRKPNPGSSSSIEAPPAANTQQCGGSCAEPSDCSAQNSCLCASDKGIPLRSTWGNFTCTFIANAAAVAAAAAAQGSNCRGRCLLQANGTLEIGDGITEPNPRPGSLDLVCPCNCTYVSEACCLSTTHLVWEDVALKAKTVLQPPNSTMCCDAQTGKFRVDGVQREPGSSGDVACSMSHIDAGT